MVGIKAWQKFLDDVIIYKGIVLSTSVKIIILDSQHLDVRELYSTCERDFLSVNSRHSKYPRAESLCDEGRGEGWGGEGDGGGGGWGGVLLVHVRGVIVDSQHTHTHPKAKTSASREGGVGSTRQYSCRCAARMSSGGREASS